METGQKMTFRAKDFPPSHGEAGEITAELDGLEAMR